MSTFFNRILAFILLLLLSPFIILILLINLISLKWDNPIFIQKRIGKNNIPFNIYKIKTINDNVSNDFGNILRNTKVDELLQLVNILNGTMSFIGPRPELVDKVDEYNILYTNYNLRHFVKPGITGWAQIHFPDAKATDVILKLPLDIYYVTNKSLKLNIIIIYKTLFLILKRIFNVKT